MTSVVVDENDVVEICTRRAARHGSGLQSGVGIASIRLQKSLAGQAPIHQVPVAGRSQQAGVRTCDSFRVTLVIDDLSSGGAERQLCMLAEGLKRRGHDVAVLVYWSGDFFAGQLEDAGVPIVRVSARNRPHLVYRVRRAIGEMRPDVVVSFLPGPSLLMELGGLPRRGFALIVSESEPRPAEDRHGPPVETQPPPPRRRGGRQLPRPARPYPAKVAPYLASRTSTITNGVDLRRFAPAESPRRHGARPFEAAGPGETFIGEEPPRAAGSSRDRPARAPGHRLEHRLVRRPGHPGGPRRPAMGAERGGRHHQTYFDRFVVGDRAPLPPGEVQVASAVPRRRQPLPCGGRHVPALSP